jgi:peptidoglycan hydrolase-like protein with peptidoglycan-binding domain
MRNKTNLHQEDNHETSTHFRSTNDRYRIARRFIYSSRDSEAQQRFADRTQQTSPVLIATAYTDLTLPTLRQGDRGRNVELLQRILQDNGSLGAAGVRLGNPNGALVNGIFGEITTSAIRDLQQRYEIPVTGQVNPTTWEVLDMHENPYRSPLPWKQ